MSDRLYDGVERASAPGWSDGESKPLTASVMERLGEQVRSWRQSAVYEFHHPRCPKYLTQGEKACRCGASPGEAVFEDALNE